MYVTKKSFKKLIPLVLLYFLGAKIFMAIFAEGATRMMLDGAGTVFLVSEAILFSKTKESDLLCFVLILCVIYINTHKIDHTIYFTLKVPSYSLRPEAI